MPDQFQSLKKKTINCKGKLLDLTIPRVMAILNITPDSFYDGSKYKDLESVRLQIEKFVSQGADIIDVGGYSSRPGADDIEESEEKRRLEPVLNLLAKNFPDVIVSLDTFRSEIAGWAIKDFGVAIINDISAGEIDMKMAETVCKFQVPYIMMHMKGTPANMQKDPKYNNVIEEIIRYFSKKNEKFLQLGLHDIIIDPGFGFGKTIDHNYQILNYLNEFKILELPIMVGLSRKSMIYKFLGFSANEALNGTSVLNTIALLKGANILRVHDVQEARECILLANKCLASNYSG